MRTTVYIDGYNLYYSRLRGSPFKWLDVVALFRDALLAVQDPSAKVVAVKFFTAPIKATYARHGADSESAQKRYHRALMLRYPELVEAIQGFHILGPSSLPRYVQGQPPNKADLNQVWMIEEKQTDVNLALHIYRDAMRSQCEQLVICSNDSDLEPALQMVRSDAPGIAIGLVMPLRETAKEEGVYPTSASRRSRTGCVITSGTRSLQTLNCRCMSLPGKNQSASRRTGRTAHDVAAPSLRLPFFDDMASTASGGPAVRAFWPGPRTPLRTQAHF